MSPSHPKEERLVYAPRCLPYTLRRRDWSMRLVVPLYLRRRGWSMRLRALFPKEERLVYAPQDPLS